MRWPCARLGVRGRRRCRPCEEHLHRRLTGTERWRLRLLLGPGRLRGTCDHHQNAGERVERRETARAGISAPLPHAVLPRNIPEPSPGARFACERGLRRTDLADKPGGSCPFAWRSCKSSALWRKGLATRYASGLRARAPWAAALPNLRSLRGPRQRSSPSTGRWT